MIQSQGQGKNQGVPVLVAEFEMKQIRLRGQLRKEWQALYTRQDGVEVILVRHSNSTVMPSHNGQRMELSPVANIGYMLDGNTIREIWTALLTDVIRPVSAADIARLTEGLPVREQEKRPRVKKELPRNPYLRRLEEQQNAPKELVTS